MYCTQQSQHLKSQTWWPCSLWSHLILYVRCTMQIIRCLYCWQLKQSTNPCWFNFKLTYFWLLVFYFWGLLFWTQVLLTKIWIPHQASLFCKLLQGLLSQSTNNKTNYSRLWPSGFMNTLAMLLILNALLKIESSRQFEHTNFDTFVEHELLALLLRPYEGHLLRHVPAVLHHLFSEKLTF